MKILRKILLVIGAISVLGIIIFCQPVLYFFVKFSFDDLKIINSFLSVIISWPLAIFVLGITFMLRFTEQIGIFLKNLRSLKFGNMEASAQQNDAPIENAIVTTESQTDLVSREELERMLANKDGEIENIKKAFTFAWERANNYEMAYLKRALVPATWLALNWLFTQESKKSTKEWFIQSIFVVDSAPDKTVEKDAIFNALLINELITFKDGIIMPTDKAERFLKYVGVMK